MISLLDIPPAQARELLATGAPAYLPVNPIEYHGPHLSLANDAIISDGLMHDLHERLREDHPDWPLLLGGRIEAGADVLPMPGSRDIPYPALCKLVLRACRSLIDLGAKRVVLMTFHGGPLHNQALQRGLEFLEARGVMAVAPLNILVTWMLDPDVSRFKDAYLLIEDVHERAQIIEAAARDFHAGLPETSLTLHFAPDAVHGHQDLPPCPTYDPKPGWMQASLAARTLGRTRLANELRFIARALGWTALPDPGGYTGRPHLATPEIGRALARGVTDMFVACVREVFDEGRRSPRAPFAWLPAVSAGGRLGKLLLG